MKSKKTNVLKYMIGNFSPFCLLLIFNILNHIYITNEFNNYRGGCVSILTQPPLTRAIDYLNVYKYRYRNFCKFRHMCTYIHSKHFCKFRHIHFYNFHYKLYNSQCYNRTYIPWLFPLLLQV